ncbi:MAG: OmpA family protein [Chakrabartia sp.]
MRKLAFAVVLATTAMASPALARDKSWYVGVEGGPSIVEDQNLDVAGGTDNAGADLRTGWDIDGLVGYDFGGFRLESELGYKRAGLTQWDSLLTTPSGSNATANPAGSYADATGRLSNLSFMLNGLLDFGEDTGLTGYVGGGAGIARTKAAYTIDPTGPKFLDDAKTGFAWQLIAGIRAPLSSSVDLGFKYRFFSQSNVDLVDRIGRANDTRYRSHSLLASLIFNLGEPAAAPSPPPPPAPPAPPPPPPPPPPVAEKICSPGPYIVFFDWDKSDVTSEAASILDNAVTAYADCGSAQVMLAGHADKSGTPKYNLALSERRNASVRTYLEGKGVPAGLISTQAFGETAPRVDTADGVRELQNRRVEITYGPGSGQ